MTKTALITGITGQDGAYLAEFLLKKGYIVHGIKRRSSLFNTDRIDHLYQDPHVESRKFILHHGDMADACAFLMNLPDGKYCSLLGSNEVATEIFMPPVVNIGVGEDLTIEELAETIKSVVGYEGVIEFDSTKPDGTPRKLMNVSRLHSLGWQARTGVWEGLAVAYPDFLSPSSRGVVAGD